MYIVTVVRVFLGTEGPQEKYTRGIQETSAVPLSHVRQDIHRKIHYITILEFFLVTFLASASEPRVYYYWSEKLWLNISFFAEFHLISPLQAKDRNSSGYN